jgi:hypothetical protein
MNVCPAVAAAFHFGSCAGCWLVVELRARLLSNTKDLDDRRLDFQIQPALLAVLYRFFAWVCCEWK